MQEDAGPGWKKYLIVHPFVFAALPVVLLLTIAKNELLPEETLPALIALEVLVSCAFAIACLLLRDVSKAAIGASFFLISLFGYRIWQISLEMYWPLVVSQPWIALVSFFVVIILALKLFLVGCWNFFGKEIALDFPRMNGVLNVISSLLLIMNVAPLVLYEISQQEAFVKERTALQKPLDAVKFKSNFTESEKPDIYYIILDGFAAPSSMKEFWNYDDPGFVDFLKGKGFYVAEQSLSNFDRTEFSLCSSLNMNYINDIRDHNKEEVSGLVFMRLIQDCAIVRAVKELGYQYVSVSSGSFGTDHILTADHVVKVNCVNHFFRAVAYCTPWWSLEYYFPVLRDFYGDTRLAAGTRMSEILGSKSPKFVFIHTDLPHAPYLFDENGNRLKLPAGLIPDWQPPLSHYKQWQFCIKECEKWIDQIQKATAGKAIIIVQSDHGSGLRMKETVDWYNERMRILNAYYLPGENKKAALYKTITPVNTFRVVLNSYFDAKLPLLKDQSYCAPVWEKPFQWQEVTSEIRFPGVTR